MSDSNNVHCNNVHSNNGHNNNGHGNNGHGNNGHGDNGHGNNGKNNSLNKTNQPGHTTGTADINTKESSSNAGDPSPVSGIAARLDEINDSLDGAHTDEILQWGYSTFGRGMVFGTGFGLPGIYLLHRIHQLGLDIPLFFLDTRLLFKETYELRETLQQRFGIQIEAIRPEISLYEQTKRFGPELWKHKPDQCCHIRKVAPLQNYLADKTAWITGVRRQQSDTRKNVKLIEYDQVNDVIKINPLAAADISDIRTYIGHHDLPYNPLHDEGYPSIGCIPCTSRVAEGEDERAGRWRGESKTECGIHFQESSTEPELIHRSARP